MSARVRLSALALSLAACGAPPAARAPERPAECAALEAALAPFPDDDDAPGSGSPDAPAAEVPRARAVALSGLARRLTERPPTGELGDAVATLARALSGHAARLRAMADVLDALDAVDADLARWQGEVEGAMKGFHKACRPGDAGCVDATRRLEGAPRLTTDQWREYELALEGFAARLDASTAGDEALRAALREVARAVRAGRLPVQRAAAERASLARLEGEFAQEAPGLLRARARVRRLCRIAPPR